MLVNLRSPWPTGFKKYVIIQNLKTGDMISISAQNLADDNRAVDAGELIRSETRMDLTS